jgi:hypothetical protein
LQGIVGVRFKRLIMDDQGIMPKSRAPRPPQEEGFKRVIFCTGKVRESGYRACITPAPLLPFASAVYRCDAEQLSCHACIQCGTSASLSCSVAPLHACCAAGTWGRIAVQVFYELHAELER